VTVAENASASCIVCDWHIEDVDDVMARHSLAVHTRDEHPGGLERWPHLKSWLALKGEAE
jgi:hypothetical protein